MRTNNQRYQKEMFGKNQYQGRVVSTANNPPKGVSSKPSENKRGISSSSEESAQARNKSCYA